MTPCDDFVSVNGVAAAQAVKSSHWADGVACSQKLGSLKAFLLHHGWGSALRSRDCYVCVHVAGVVTSLAIV